MPAAEKTLSKRELLKELGISDRLLKFWVGWYKLPINRRGRASNYPHRTIETLRLIKKFSDGRYFTMRFVRDLLRAAEGGDRSAIDAHLSYCRALLARTPTAPVMPPVTASKFSSVAVSPSADSSPARPSPAAPRAKKMGTDLL